MSEAPEITVAVATFERRESALETLRRLAEQTYDAERWDVVLVVDGSTDGTAAAARALELPYALRVHEQPNRGLAAARNAGAALASRPVVAFLDDDIRPEPQWLAAHAAAHAAAPVPTTVLGAYPPAPPAPGADPWATVSADWWTAHFARKADRGHRWSCFDVVDGNLSVLVHDFERLGGLDERFRHGRRQDYELGIRLLRAGRPLAYAPDARGRHDLDGRFATALRHSVSEGIADVQIAREHPAAATRLALATLDPAASPGPSPRRLRRPATWPVLPARSRTPLTAGRGRATDQARLIAGYVEGALREAGGTDALPALLADLQARRAAELADGVTPPGLLPLEVPVALPGGGAVRVPVPPGQQWDTDAMAAAAVAMSGGALSHDAASDALCAGTPVGGRR